MVNRVRTFVVGSAAMAAVVGLGTAYAQERVPDRRTLPSNTVAAAPSAANPRETLVEILVQMETLQTGKYYLDDRKIKPKALRIKIGKIMELRPQTPVLIRGDSGVAYGRVVEAMTLLQEAGVPSVGLVTQTPDRR